jgi:hypothetical protein
MAYCETKMACSSGDILQGFANYQQCFASDLFLHVLARSQSFAFLHRSRVLIID